MTRGKWICQLIYDDCQEFKYLFLIEMYVDYIHLENMDGN